MKKKKVGTITLAVGLIILGVVLFINNFTNIGLVDIYKYWPVLIIGVGLEMFVYMIIYRQDENVKLRIDVLCIIFIIAAAIFANNADFKFDPKLSFNIFDNIQVVDGVKYKGELKESVVKDNISKDFTINKLDIKNSFGDIKLMPYDQKYIKIEALVKIKYNDESAAKEYLKDAIKIAEGEQTHISVGDYNNINKNNFSRAMIDFVVYVPQGAEVNVDNSFGDIQVQGISKDLVISNQHGNIVAKNIGGGASIKNSFGDIELKNIGGKAEADNQHGDIDAAFINGEARIETSFGALGISDIKGNLNARNNYGKITVNNVSGDAEIRSSFGDIDASYVDGSSIINDNNGSIDVNELKGNVQIKNSFGRIDYRSSNSGNADIYAKTKFGKINTNLPITISKSGAIDEYTAQGKTGEGKNRIELTTNNGEIEIK